MATKSKHIYLSAPVKLLAIKYRLSNSFDSVWNGQSYVFNNILKTCSKLNIRNISDCKKLLEKAIQIATNKRDYRMVKALVDFLEFIEYKY